MQIQVLLRRNKNSLLFLTSLRQEKNSQNPDEPISFSLINLHKHVLGYPPEQSHGAEADCISLMRTTAALGIEWINWVKGNCYKFESCKRMWGQSKVQTSVIANIFWGKSRGSNKYSIGNKSNSIYVDTSLDNILWNYEYMFNFFFSSYILLKKAMKGSVNLVGLQWV